MLHIFKKFYFLLFLSASLSGIVTKAYAYDRVQINNFSTSSGFAEVEYAGCNPDRLILTPAIVGRNGIQPSSSHAPVSRGACLVTKISAYFGEYVDANGKPYVFRFGGPLPVWKDDGIEVNPYNSSGTSYVSFTIAQRDEKRFRIMSDAEIKYENVDVKMSPGFKILNRTIWPLSIALTQVGCIYYDTIKPGQFFDRNTGAVWFTIQAEISKDGIETRTNWDCAKPVAEVVGGIALAALTGGVAGVAGAGTTFAAGASAAAAKETAKWAAETIGSQLLPTSEGSLKGQYAGPPYPFRCTNKPEYEITGGWGAPTLNEKGEPVIPPGTPLQIRKINNGC